MRLQNNERVVILALSQPARNGLAVMMREMHFG